ncbi:MAG: hypothetical protein H0W62_11665 [Chitinophagales bacterium]|nr:hypothetical protein [Chitinophagales bacterium]
MKKKKFLILIAGFEIAGYSCKKPDFSQSNPTAPLISCPVKEYKDGRYWQTIIWSNITCEECKAKSGTHTTHDTQFNIDYTIRDSSWCE